MNKKIAKKKNNIKKNIIENFNIEKKLSEYVTATRDELKEIGKEKEEIIKKLNELKEMQRFEDTLNVCGQMIKAMEHFIEEAEHALLREFKGYMAYKKTELELGECQNTEQFAEIFRKNLMDPSFVKNNNIESLRREAKEKYGIDFTN